MNPPCPVCGQPALENDALGEGTCPAVVECAGCRHRLALSLLGEVATAVMDVPWCQRMLGRVDALLALQTEQTAELRRIRNEREREARVRLVGGEPGHPLQMDERFWAGALVGAASAAIAILAVGALMLIV